MKYLGESYAGYRRLPIELIETAHEMMRADAQKAQRIADQQARLDRRRRG